MLALFTHKKSLLRCRRDQKEGLLCICDFIFEIVMKHIPFDGGRA